MAEVDCIGCCPLLKSFCREKIWKIRKILQKNLILQLKHRKAEFNSSRMCLIFCLQSLSENKQQIKREIRWNVQLVQCLCQQQQQQQLVPGSLVPRMGLVRAIPSSVIPYLSRRRCPVICSQLWSTGVGRAAEPDTNSLRVDNDRQHRSTEQKHL